MFKFFFGILLATVVSQSVMAQQPNPLNCEVTGRTELDEVDRADWRHLLMTTSRCNSNLDCPGAAWCVNGRCQRP